jgi:hypothetical protein
MRKLLGRKTQGRWTGESGYCNCLLVAMARAQVARIEISTAQALPNLEELVRGRPDTLAWIRAQGFEYDRLDRVTIMRTLSEFAGISPQAKCFDGTLEVTDCVGDDGPVVERTFSLQLGNRGEAVVLAITQDGANVVGLQV